MIPRADIHRHFSGCLAADIVHRLLAQQCDYFPIDDIRKMITFSGDDPYDFNYFLSKFQIFNRIRWTEYAIIDSIQYVIDGLVKEQIHYAEIQFSIGKYLSSGKWTPAEVIGFVGNVFNELSQKAGVKVGLLLSLRYDSDRSKQMQVASIIEDVKSEYLCGISLVGDEAYFDPAFYSKLLRPWKLAGKGIVVHAGESRSAENVRRAILDVGADRIAHGIRVPAEDPSILSLAKDRNVCFDIAPTSNILTGVCSSDLTQHPVKHMINAGCAVSIGTDDPAICETTLDYEYHQLRVDLGLSDDQLEEIAWNSIKYSFINRQK